MYLRNVLFHFGIITRNLSSGSVSVRRNLRLSCFSWRPQRKPIWGALVRSSGGRAWGHSIQAGQNLGWRWEDWSEGGRLVWMGPQPSGNETLPCPGQREATPSFQPGDAGQDRPGLCLFRLALEPRRLSFIFLAHPRPSCQDIVQTLQREE